jgi:hypothetical protein
MIVLSEKLTVEKLTEKQNIEKKIVLKNAILKLSNVLKRSAILDLSFDGRS